LREYYVGGSKLDPSDMSRTLKEYYVGGLKLDPCKAAILSNALSGSYYKKKFTF
jgi:hypothetical protein